jgi:hypothetical protein
MSNIQMSEAKQSSYFRIEEKRLFKSLVGEKRKSTIEVQPSTDKKFAAKNVGDKETVAGICYHDFLEKIGATTKAGKPWPKCSNRNCSFTHMDVSVMSKGEQVNVATKFGAPFKKFAMDALKK